MVNRTIWWIFVLLLNESTLMQLEERICWNLSTLSALTGLNTLLMQSSILNSLLLPMFKSIWKHKWMVVLNYYYFLLIGIGIVIVIIVVYIIAIIKWMVVLRVLAEKKFLTSSSKAGRRLTSSLETNTDARVKNKSCFLKKGNFICLWQNFIQPWF